MGDILFLMVKYVHVSVYFSMGHVITGSFLNIYAMSLISFHSVYMMWKYVCSSLWVYPVLHDSYEAYGHSWKCEGV